MKPSVLFVCRQNIGRSQMAAALYNKYSEQGHAESAGTAVTTEGETLQQFGADNVIKVMADEGIDVAQSQSHQVSHETLRGIGKIVVMAEPEAIPEWLSDDPRFEYWETPDPKFSDLETTRQIFEQIKHKVLELIEIG